MAASAAAIRPPWTINPSEYAHMVPNIKADQLKPLLIRLSGMVGWIIRDDVMCMENENGDISFIVLKVAFFSRPIATGPVPVGGDN